MLIDVLKGLQNRPTYSNFGIPDSIAGANYTEVFNFTARFENTSLHSIGLTQHTTEMVAHTVNYHLFVDHLQQLPTNLMLSGNDYHPSPQLDCRLIVKDPISGKYHATCCGLFLNSQSMEEYLKQSRWLLTNCRR